MKYVPRKVPSLRAKKSTYTMDAYGIHDVETPTSKLDKDNLAQSVWELWHQITERSDSRSNPEVVEMIDKEITKGGWDNAPLYRVEVLVRSALYIPPKMNDPLDVKRLVLVFTSSHTRQLAEENRSNILSRKYPYKSTDDVQERIKDISKKLNISELDTLSDKEQASLVVLTEMDPDEFDLYYANALNNFPDKINPSDIVLMSRKNSLYPSTNKEDTFRFTSAKTRSKDKNFEAGRDEEKSLFSESMEVDLDASQMIIEGYTTETILSFHGDCPRGYWGAVLEEVSKGDVEVRGIYDRLKPRFNWHPSQRRKPELV